MHTYVYTLHKHITYASMYAHVCIHIYMIICTLSCIHVPKNITHTRIFIHVHKYLCIYSNIYISMCICHLELLLLQ